jgi:hypothetical protein
MDKYREEVRHVGGEALLKVVDKEFLNSFVIIGRDQDQITLGDKFKNVKFSREKFRVLERFVLDVNRALSRKTPY